jgi:outer membrane immunogenic protein
LRISTSAILATIIVAPLATAASAAQFDGPYVGAQVGWQSEKMRDVKSSFGVVPVDQDKRSVTGGVFAGYDKTIRGRFVVGAEAGLDFASDDKVQSNVGGSNYSVDPKYSFDLTARAGYLVNPQTLLYVRGGYTNARVRTTITNAAGIQSESDNQDGWLAGAGFERQVAQNVSARIEYRYSKFTEGDGKDQRHRVLAGLSYRF